MDCLVCGYKNLPDNGNFCIECGANITQVSKTSEVQLQVFQKLYNSEGTGINVDKMNANTLNIQFYRQSSIQVPNHKKSFCSLVEWIAEKSVSLEKLHPAYGKELFKIIQQVKNLSQNQQSNLDFTSVEIQVLELLYNFCHFYLKGSISRSEEFSQFQEADYYSLLETLVKSKKQIRFNNIKLSSLVENKKLVKLLQILEKKIDDI